VESLERRDLLDAGMSSHYITGLYYSMLQREPTGNEVVRWIPGLEASGNRAQVVSGFLSSTEHESAVIVNDYRTILGRDPEPAGLQAWVGLLQHGVTSQQMMAAILASDEFFQKQGGTNPNWLASLYQKILGREADPTGLDAWGQMLDGGASRADVARTFLNSTEEATKQVQDGYRSILGREADSAGLNYWVSAIGQGMTWEQVQQGLASSQEFFNAQQGADLPLNGDIPLGVRPTHPKGHDGESTTSTGNGTHGADQGANDGTAGNPSGAGLNFRGGNGGSSSGGSGSRTSMLQAASGTRAKSLLTVGPAVNASRMRGNQSEPSIAIDPTNPKRMFVASNQNNLAGPGLFAAFTTDGGLTWTPRVIADGNDGLPPGFTDPSVVWDEFGNLFFSYIPTNGTVADIVMSTDGGVTFRTLAGFNAVDQPKMAVGAGMIWIVYNNGAGTAADPGGVEAAGARVTGLGQVEPFTAPFHVPGSLGGNFGAIAIGPKGQVTVSFQQAGSGVGPDIISVSTKLDGVGPGQFSAPLGIASPKIGGFRPIPPQPVRTIDAESKLAYDRSGGPHNGRLYHVYTGAADIFTNNTQIFEQYSDDNGMHWTNPVTVNDANFGRSDFFPWVAVDQTTGNVAVSWYDTRNDQGGGPGDTNGIPNDDVECFVTASINGGVSFLPNVQVAPGPSNAIAAGSLLTPPAPNNGGNDFGDYMGMAFQSGRIAPAWVDNSRQLGNNPDLPNFDIGVAVVTLNVPIPSFVIRPPDRFEPNDTSDTAHDFDILSPGTQVFPNLSITRHENGLPDTDWYRWSIGQSGTFSVTIDYKTFDGLPGDLHMRVFTLDRNNNLVQLGASLSIGVTRQRVSVTVTRGQPILVWVYGFDGAEASYDMSVSLV
jgi:hypothetical protein